MAIICLAIATAVNRISAAVESADQSGIAAALKVAPRSEIITQPWHVVSRGQHENIWESVRATANPIGAGPSVKRHRVVELAGGLNRAVNGNWMPSSPHFVLTESGAEATNTGHRVVLPADINAGNPVQITTPDGTLLISSPIAVAYYNPEDGNYLLLAVVTNSVGLLVSSNEIVYSNCFVGALRASVQYRNLRSGISQNLVIHERPTDPEPLGFSSKSRLVLVTEFSPETAAPGVTKHTIRSETNTAIRAQMFEPDLVDETLAFGSMKMGRGHAFLLSAEKDRFENHERTKVFKQFQRISNRPLLLEQVEHGAIRSLLHKLPLHLQQPIVTNAALHMPLRDMYASAKSKQQHVASRGKQTIRIGIAQSERALAAARLPEFVLDYELAETVSTTYRFLGDTTYYVSGSVQFNAPVIVEGGTVIKFDPDSENYLYVAGQPLVCETAPYRPAIVTVRDDDNVGEVLPQSDGLPEKSPALVTAFALDFAGQIEIRNLRFKYIANAFWLNGGPYRVMHSQYMHVKYPFLAEGSALNVLNALVINSDTAFLLLGADLTAEQVTIDKSQFLSDGNAFASMRLRNSLLLEVDSLSVPDDYWDEEVYIEYAGSSVFQSAAAGKHYLRPGSPYRNTGAQINDSELARDIRTMTTEAPKVLADATVNEDLTLRPQVSRDVGAPDIGYHYWPLDYVFGGVTMNGNMTVLPGTAIAWFRTSSGWQHAGYGVRLGDGKIAVLDGRADAMVRWVREDVVQEDEALGHTFGPGGISSWASTVADAAEIHARFVEFSMLAGDSGHHYRDDWGHLRIRAEHCEYSGGGAAGYWLGAYYTNCLFQRTFLGVEGGSSATDLVMRNCTMRGSLLWVNRYAGGGSVSIRDTIFDRVRVEPVPEDAYSWNSTLTDYDYNVFVSGQPRTIPLGVHDVVSSGLAWDEGQLGKFYIPNGSVIYGSRVVNNARLAHFTTSTYQLPYLGTVHRGFHYIALENGVPIDSDEDGVPDYLEDLQGNGITTDDPTAFNIYNSPHGLSSGSGLQVFTPLK